MNGPFDRSQTNVLRFVASIASSAALQQLLEQEVACDQYIEQLNDLPQNAATLELRERAFAQRRHLDSIFLFVATGPDGNDLVV